MAVLRGVAARLGNTVAVCRKQHVHPAVLALAQTPLDEREAPMARKSVLGRVRGLRAAESQLLQFLRVPQPR